MELIKITHQHRRDFVGVLKCEACQSKQEVRGYDDRNYHDNVIPNIKCEKCGKSSADLGITHEPTPTKYQAWEVV